MENNSSENDNLLSSIPTDGLFEYKNKRYMSEGAFDTLVAAIQEQTLMNSTNNDNNKSKHNSYNSYNSYGSTNASLLRDNSNNTRVTRSSSVSSLNPSQVDGAGRRALYGSLPFFAAHGMRQRETALKHVLSSVASLESLGPDVALSTPSKLIDEEDDIDEIVVTIPLIMAVIVAIVSQFLVGYNTAVMNAPEPYVFPGHSLFFWALTVSAFAVGGPFGAILGGILSNKKGRRGAMLINAWIFFIGGIAMTFAPSIYWLLPARFIIGFASGLATVVVPVYLGEIAPPTLRGSLGTCTQFALVVGILVSNILAIFWAKSSCSNCWRYLFGVTPVLALMQLVVSPFLLESPRWLLSISESSRRARKVIKRLRGFRTEEDVEAEVNNFLFANQKHKTKFASAHSIAAFWDVLTDPKIRLLVVSAVVLQAAQQLSGINAVFYYSNFFFADVISNPVEASALVALINVLATFLALIVMDTIARRVLLIVSSSGMLLSTIAVVIALYGYLPDYVALVGIMSFVGFFEIGLGPIPWLIVAEMFETKHVASAMSISCIVNWFCNFVVGISFPWLHSSLGPLAFLPFLFILSLTLLFVMVVLPETQGRSIEQVQRLAKSAALEYRNINNNGSINSIHSMNYSLSGSNRSSNSSYNSLEMELGLGSIVANDNDSMISSSSGSSGSGSSSSSHMKGGSRDASGKKLLNARALSPPLSTLLSHESHNSQ